MNIDIIVSSVILILFSSHCDLKSYFMILIRICQIVVSHSFLPIKICFGPYLWTWKPLLIACKLLHWSYWVYKFRLSGWFPLHNIIMNLRLLFDDPPIMGDRSLKRDWKEANFSSFCPYHCSKSAIVIAAKCSWASP